MRLSRRMIRRVKEGRLAKSGPGYHFMRLVDYYDSTTWEDLRNQALRRDGGVCVECGSRYDLHVHHTRYPEFFFLDSDKYINIESDTIENLTTLCARHHADRHSHLIVGNADPAHLSYLYEEEDPVAEIDFRYVTFEGEALDPEDENVRDSDSSEESPELWR